MTRYSSFSSTDATTATRALCAAFRPGHPAHNAGIQSPVLAKREDRLGSVWLPELPVI